MIRGSSKGITQTRSHASSLGRTFSRMPERYREIALNTKKNVPMNLCFESRGKSDSLINKLPLSVLNNNASQDSSYLKTHTPLGQNTGANDKQFQDLKEEYFRLKEESHSLQGTLEDLRNKCTFKTKEAVSQELHKLYELLEDNVEKLREKTKEAEMRGDLVVLPEELNPKGRNEIHSLEQRK